MEELEPNSSEELDPHVGRTMLDELIRLTQKKRRLAQIGRALTALMALAIIAAVLAIFVFHVRAPWASFLSFGSVLVNAVARRAMASDYESSLAQTLQTWGDARAIGPLAQALTLRGIDQGIVTSALATLLPKLKASDTPLLGSDDRAALYRALTLDRNKHAEFFVALLGALGQIGDPAALPHVEGLLKRLPDTPEEQQVFEAAYGCLAALKEAAQLEQQKQTLLRPAEGTQQAASLLRAATPASDEVALLLRAAVTEHGEKEA